MSDKAEPYGLLSAAEEWRDWFAWRPVVACGQWRWLTYVQRRRKPGSQSPIHTYLSREWPWDNLPEDWPSEYRTRRSHNYVDETETRHMHSHIYT
jgi:hypothetical protein